jgi:hypothetical protein
MYSIKKAKELDAIIRRRLAEVGRNVVLAELISDRNGLIEASAEWEDAGFINKAEEYRQDIPMLDLFINQLRQPFSSLDYIPSPLLLSFRNL